MKNFELTLRPLSSDYRKAQREIGFGVESFQIHRPRSANATSSTETGPLSPGCANDRPLTAHARIKRRADRIVQKAEKTFQSQSRKELARLQFERVWLKRKLVVLLTKNRS